MQEGDVGASNSDLQTDRADDDVTRFFLGVAVEEVGEGVRAQWPTCI